MKRIFLNQKHSDLFFKIKNMNKLYFKFRQMNEIVPFKKFCKNRYSLTNFLKNFLQDLFSSILFAKSETYSFFPRSKIWTSYILNSDKWTRLCTSKCCTKINIRWKFCSNFLQDIFSSILFSSILFSSIFFLQDIFS